MKWANQKKILLILVLIIYQQGQKKDFYILQVCYNKLMNQQKTKRLSSSDQLRHTTKIGTLSFVNGKIMGI